MRKFNIKKAAKVTSVGVAGVWDVLRFLMKAIGTLLLIVLLTGMIFACIFVIYIKTNLMTEDLGVSLSDYSVNQTSIIYYTDSETGEYKELTQLRSSENRIWIDYENIPKALERAVVSIEDKRFYTHNGVDWFRTAFAFVNMFLGMRNTFGGSTLTQQLIKNITPDDDSVSQRTVQVKLTEIFSALELEKNYDKAEIIEWYLNVVFFGHGNYGIVSAADYYFDKEVSELTLAEMCSIVGITNNPSLYSPKASNERNKKRQELILGEMLANHYISQEEYDEAVAQELVFSWEKEDDSEEEEEEVVETSGVYSYFVDAIIEDVISCFMEERNISYRAAETLLFTGGFKIYATIDVDIQEKVDSIYEDLTQIPKASGSTQQFQSAIVITDPCTGDIVALSGGVGEKTESRGFNRATMAKRAPGSSLKPLAVYAPAMDLGLITPDTRYEDEADIKLDGTDWFPKNDDHRNYGVVTIRTGIRRSLNTIAAQVLDDLTLDVSYDFLANKLQFGLVEADLNYSPLSMGQLTKGITTRDMATAYGIFVNDGIYTESRLFTHITDANDEMIYDNSPDAYTVISDTTAYWITDILSEAATSGTGWEANLGTMPTAGKTGTSGDKHDRWFVGYTPYYVAAVWTGFDTPASITVSGNPAAQLWKKVMTLVCEDLEYKEFSTPASTYQQPVPGVDEAVTYYIRGIGTDPYGDLVVLYEEEAGTRGAGRTVSAKAKTVAEYTLVGSSEKSITLTDDPMKNFIEFTYVSNNPVTVTPEPEPEPDPGGNDPSTEDPDTGSPGDGEGGDDLTPIRSFIDSVINIFN